MKPIKAPLIASALALLASPAQALPLKKFYSWRDSDDKMLKFTSRVYLSGAFSAMELLTGLYKTENGSGDRLAPCLPVDYESKFYKDKAEQDRIINIGLSKYAEIGTENVLEVDVMQYVIIGLLITYPCTSDKD